MQGCARGTPITTLTGQFKHMVGQGAIPASADEDAVPDNVLHPKHCGIIFHKRTPVITLLMYTKLKHLSVDSMLNICLCEWSGSEKMLC